VKRRGALIGFAAVVLACLVLGLIGLRVEGRLSPLSRSVPGTSAESGEKLAESHFGTSSPFVILLRGPRPALERQGPELVAALRRDRDATVISPWDRGALAALRPNRHKALVLEAAAIMAAVFVSFAAAPIATVSQMGVGLTVARAVTC
jgi:uncharacterized membrane protein YdfJ with MMPL/SSD domain